MKEVVIWRCLVIVFIFIVSCHNERVKLEDSSGVVVSLEEENFMVIEVACDSWLPYIGVDGENRGYILSLLKKIYGPYGYDIKYFNMPWKRCIESVKAGDVLALACASKVEAIDCLIPQEPIGESVPSFFVRSNSKWRYSGLESLRLVRLGVIGGSTYSKEIDDYILKSNSDLMTLTGADAHFRFYRLLKEERIGAFVESTNVANYYIKKYGIEEEIINAGKAGEGELLYLAFNKSDKRSKKLVELFDVGIAELRESGELEVFLAQYNLFDWKRK